jgi:hypothetical protein
MRKSYELELRHRPSPKESIEARHSKVVDALLALGPEWGIKPGTTVPAAVIPPGDLAADVDLKGVLPFAKKASVVYRLRKASYLEDAAQFDDYLIAEFNPDKIDFARLALEAFPAYIGAFECYRAGIFDTETANADWRVVAEKSEETGKDINGRDGVYRIKPVNFFDRVLCKRAFNRTPEQIKKALTGHVERVELLHDGVYIVASSRVLPEADVLKIDAELRRLL